MSHAGEDRTSDGASLAEQVERSGYCILRDVISPDCCGSIAECVSAAVARERANYPHAPPQVGFTPSIINHEQSFAPYLAASRLMELLTQLLGEHLRISFTSAIINEPGNARGAWHADWPFNQKNAGRIPAPYPDIRFHVTTLWMLSPFTAANGGTLIVPGSHQRPTNPTATPENDPQVPLPDEEQVCGPAGSVLVMDSRLWHATAPNRSDEPRVALAVRYAPWWLNLEVLRPESGERARMCVESGRPENEVPSLRRDVFERLPSQVQPLYRHWVEGAAGADSSE